MEPVVTAQEVVMTLTPFSNGGVASVGSELHGEFDSSEDSMVGDSWPLLVGLISFVLTKQPETSPLHNPSNKTAAAAHMQCVYHHRNHRQQLKD